MTSSKDLPYDFDSNSGRQVQEKDPAPAPPIGCLTTSSGNVADPAGSLPIITGNWGCGSALCGDPQLKSMIQWMAASRSGAPCVIYYTSGDSSIVKVSQHSRVALDGVQDRLRMQMSSSFACNRSPWCHVFIVI